MAYAEMEKVEAGLRFKTPSGLTVETTGSSVKVESHNIYVHEVSIVEGSGEGQTFLHNLDKAEKL